jgi:argininosuccinate lyase
MRAEAETGFLNATDLADFLVRRGMPFRRAHRVSGEAVRYCLEEGKRLEEMSAEEWQAVAPGVDAAVQKALGLDAVLEARAAWGGTARKQVRRQIRLSGKDLEKKRERLRRDMEKASAASNLL